MALVEQSTPKSEGKTDVPQPALPPDPPRGPQPASGRPSESLLAAGLAIEGKIGGNGHVRLAGRFKGTIDISGELTIEAGARVDGEVQGDTVLVGGEVHGNVASKSRVELRESAVLIGDLKAVSLTVAAGSKMRGQVEFGWKDGEAQGPPPTRSTPAR